MLKIYQWEHKQFQDLYDIHVLPDYKERVVRALAESFKIRLGAVQYTTLYNAAAYPMYDKLKLPRKACPLGLMIHELAHLYNWQVNKQRGHRKTFKTSLIKLMVETKYLLPKLLYAKAS